MPEVTPLQAAVNNARQALAHGAPGTYERLLATSWQAFLDHVAETRGDGETVTEAYNRRQANARVPMIDSLVNDITAAVQLLRRIEPLEVRADLAEALGHKLEITPEEPDPGRDWSRVRGELFNPGGKWKYSVWLDYSGLRSAPNERGCGPAGWYFAGAAMAEQALAIATDNHTSGVRIRELGTYWHLFVPDPPQGYPIWVRPALAENENQLSFDHYQDVKTRLEAAEGKIEAVRAIVEADEFTDRIAAISRVLNR